jgi:hypothetical protein
MKAVLLIFAALFACGFILETPESKKAQADAERKWKKEVVADYDRSALLQFLRNAIAEKKQFEGIDLAKVRIGRRWKFKSMSMVCGDWVFVRPLGTKDGFEIQYADDKEKYVAFECIREERDRFRLVRIYKDEWILLDA